MVITFRSSAAADVMMLEQHAQQVLSLIGKQARQGTITAQEMPGAVAQLEQHVEDSKRHAVTSALVRDVAAHGVESPHLETDSEVSFAARAYPLLSLLQAARDAGSDVAWDSGEAQAGR